MNIKQQKQLLDTGVAIFKLIQLATNLTADAHSQIVFEVRFG
ncbi:hypothetical protein swp_4498 [Shewanella piezotolerans WP3]|uniref:Uncharacterized protein n=1 Tax=Shewanella piezotolerans (strain WP3 / JCM 13877) TaxID=225849 RepID=B8CUF0_SHEPW|nr:hypothetical protein swp_4498 [Shewanella piezotolerans WP3]